MSDNMFADLGEGLTGLELLKSWMESGKRPGIAVSLDFDLVLVEDGFVVFEGVPGLHAYNPIGTVHGGYAAALLDSACGCACQSKLGPDQAYTTLELKVAYHKAMTKETGKVRAEGRIASISRRAAFSEAKLVDGTGRLLASATSSLLVMPRR